MIKTIFKAFPGVAVLAAVSPLSQANPVGAVIHFQGAIVERGSDISSQERAAKITCPHQSKSITQTVAYSKLADDTVHSDNMMQTTIYYPASHRHFAIVSATYP